MADRQPRKPAPIEIEEGHLPSADAGRSLRHKRDVRTGRAEPEVSSQLSGANLESLGSAHDGGHWPARRGLACSLTSCDARSSGSRHLDVSHCSPARAGAPTPRLACPPPQVSIAASPLEGEGMRAKGGN